MGCVPSTPYRLVPMEPEPVKTRLHHAPLSNDFVDPTRYDPAKHHPSRLQVTRHSFVRKRVRLPK